MTLDIDSLVITVEKDVPQPTKRRRRTAESDEKLAQLRAMEIDHSFFIQDATKKDLRQLVDLARRNDIALKVYEVEQDEIYQMPGVRVFRVDPSEVRRRRMPAVTSGSQPEQGTPQPQPDQVRYWHHSESGCVFKTGPGTDRDHPGGWEIDEAMTLAEIDEAEYIRLSVEYDDL